MSRALFLLIVAAPLATAAPAHAQPGGIQIAPVMVVMSTENSITSLRVRNTRDRAVSFEVDAYEWRQRNGEDLLAESTELIAAPGVFEVPAGGEQIVRLGVAARVTGVERAYRIILRELPTQRSEGNVLGFTLEMSLPVFVSPIGAQARLETRVESRDWGLALVISNTGDAHAQIASLEDVDAGVLPAPRYLLPGASAEVMISPRSRTIRLRGSESNGSQTERLVHVDAPDSRASLR